MYSADSLCFLVFFFLFLPSYSSAFTFACPSKFSQVLPIPILNWAQKAGGSGNDQANGVAVDSTSGAIYISGYFSSNGITFPPSTVFTSSGNNDIFLAKFVANGTLAWAVKAGGTGSDQSSSVAVDPTSGSVYLTGLFASAPLSFPSSAITLSSAGGSDAFVAKYYSNGTLAWATKAGGSTGDEYGSALAVDPVSGAVYVTGFFASNTFIFASTSLTLTNGGSFSDVFLAKYFPNGTLSWAMQVASPNNDNGNSVAVDPTTGSVYLTGFFGSATLSFPPSSVSLSNSGGSDVFLAKYLSNGTLAWATKASSSSNDYGNSVAVDSKSGSVYLSGYYSAGPFNFASPSTVSLSNSGGNDAFLAKYYSNGTLAWAVKAGGTNNDNGNSVAVDANLEYVYMAGFFGPGGISFPPSSLSLSTFGSDDGYLAAFFSNGTAAWATRVGGSSNDNALSVAVDSTVGTVFMSGLFASTGNFPPASVSLSSTGGTDAFLASYQPNTPICNYKPNAFAATIRDTCSFALNGANPVVQQTAMTEVSNTGTEALSPSFRIASRFNDQTAQRDAGQSDSGFSCGDSGVLGIQCQINLANLQPTNQVKRVFVVK